MATSGGKSLIYTLPTVVYGKITIVVTPTIVLRNDQVDQLKRMQIQAYQLSFDGENSVTIHDLPTLSSTSIIFITPEKLITDDTIQALEQLANRGRICLLTVDECHLISEWAGFRDSFLQIPKVFRRINNACKG